MSDIELPSLQNHTYSQLDRPRRTNRKLPKKFWGCVYRCTEYPDGIYIDENGLPRPEVNISELSYDPFGGCVEDGDDIKSETDSDESILSPSSYDNIDMEYQKVCELYLDDHDYIPSTSGSESEFDISKSDIDDDEDEMDYDIEDDNIEDDDCYIDKF